jgi:hypothetical protein
MTHLEHSGPQRRADLRRLELVQLKAPLPPQRFGFLPTQEFWELAIYTPIFALSCIGYFCLVGVIAYLLGTSISSFALWHHVLLAVALGDGMRPIDCVSLRPGRVGYIGVGCSPRAIRRKTLAASRC